MKLFLLSSILFLQALSAPAQLQERIAVHKGDVLARHFTYRFPAFEQATVLFKDGTSAASQMNFNTLLSQLEFINSKGDTIAVVKPEETDSIRFANSTFFFKKIFFEILGNSEAARLVVSRKARMESVMIGAMGVPSRVGTIQGYRTADDGQLHMDVTLNEDLNIYKETEYQLINKEGDFVKAGKKSFLEIFRDNKSAVEDYLKTNNVNFNKQEDVEKLFRFCTHQE